MSLAYIGQQLSLYVGSFLFITGLIGNGINIFIFSSVRSYRRTPCTFYFLVGSIVDMIYIIINLIIRFIGVNYGVDLAYTSLIWCKIRSFIVGLFGGTSFSCSCLTIIDQFLVTSQDLNRRQLSNIKWAHRIVLIVIIVSCLQSIPIFIYYNIPPVINACMSVNVIYATYATIFIVYVMCIIPITIMIVFGYLTYRNIRLTRALVMQHADRQLTRMTLCQVMLVTISMTPSGVYNIYRSTTSGMTKNSDRQMKETFVNLITILFSYFYYIVYSFIFLIFTSIRSIFREVSIFF